jgi:hypothetical protein
MDDYFVTPKKKEWLSSPLEAFAGRDPTGTDQRGPYPRDLVVEFDRLREGQPI